MYLWVFLFFIGWVIGLLVVAANPSPYFAALGLVFAVGVGGVLVLLFGSAYLCFVLTLVYLGGILVVFAYTAAMAADPFPDTLGASNVLNMLLSYCLGGVMGAVYFWRGEKGLFGDFINKGEVSGVVRADIEGVAFMYGEGGWSLVMCAWGLLVALFVVIEVVRGPSRGALRAVK